MIRASDLLGCRLRTESGEIRGHVYELRAIREGDRLRLEGLGVSARGMLERLGVIAARRPEPTVTSDLYRWEDVVAVRDGEVVVRDGTQAR